MSDRKFIDCNQLKDRPCLIRENYLYVRIKKTDIKDFMSFSRVTNPKVIPESWFDSWEFFFEKYLKIVDANLQIPLSRYKRPSRDDNYKSTYEIVYQKCKDGTFVQRIPLKPLPPTPYKPPPTVDIDPNDPRLRRGCIQVTLTWNTTDDLDLAVTSPLKEEVSYSRTRGIENRARSGGFLDIDSNVNGSPLTLNPVENIVWPCNPKPPRGSYRVTVRLYKYFPDNRPIVNVAFTLRISLNLGKTFISYSGTLQGEGRTFTRNFNYY